MANDELVKTNQELPLQSASSYSENSLPDYKTPIPILVEQLHLAIFDAAQGELSACKGDETCLYYAKQIKSWRCAASVCDGEGTGILPTACFEGFAENYSKKDLALINEAICPFIKDSNIDTRKVLSGRIPSGSDNSLVEVGAYLLAFKGNADLCQDSIKKYVGEFGPNWNFKWYRALTGCSILAGKSTREQEEKDYFTWFVKQKGVGDCSKMMNSVLKDACNSPEAPYPTPAYELLPGISQMGVGSTTNKNLIDSLQIKKYKAILEDASKCNGDKDCLSLVKKINKWFCAATACKSTEGNNKNPIECFQDVANEVSDDKKAEVIKQLCTMLNTPSPETRKALLANLPDEKNLIEPGAYLLAMNGSAQACQNYIKDYWGSYGPKWKPYWYVALSGCRILARESTVEQEEKDFSTWLSVIEGVNNCSGIENSELRNACNTPGATSPKPGYDE